MNDLDFYWRGLLIGFAIAAPVGPIGVLCIRRTLAYGRLTGFVSGLGAAVADATYGSIAAFGLAFLSTFLVQQQVWLRLLGGLFLLYLGLRAFLTRPTSETGGSVNRSLLGAFASTFLLTLTNPLTILSFAAVFTGLGLAGPGGDYSAATRLVLGVFSGSASWWLILSGLAGLFRQRLNPNSLAWVNRIAGGVILAFGIVALLSLESNGGRIASSLVRSDKGSSQAASPVGYARAEEGKPLIFPQDYGPHPDYQTEWWYYTGNLVTAEGRRFGYQLTFFRRALVPPAQWESRRSAWGTDQAYMAHLTLTDVTAQDHQAFERLQRGSAGLAGAQAVPFQVWLDDWQVVETAPNTYHLQASVPANEGHSFPLALDLELKDLKGPVLQGDRGYSQKGPDPGDASYYYSLTRLASTGVLQVGEKTFSVSGWSWMDHEYSTSALSISQVGWDWFSIQLDNNTEFMLFQIRQADGSNDPYSSGTLVYSDGSTRHLKQEDFTIQVEATWRSRASGGVYPSRWKVQVPSTSLELELLPLVPDQENNLTYRYWEGAVQVSGQVNGKAVNGYGYVELTGYAGSMGGEF